LYSYRILNSPRANYWRVFLNIFNILTDYIFNSKDDVVPEFNFEELKLNMNQQ